MRLLPAVLAFALALSFAPMGSAEPLPPGTCDGPNESVKDDVYATVVEGDPQCGSLSDPCFDDEPWGCGGCGPPLVEWVLGIIHCP